MCDHGDDLILCGIVVNLCSFSSKPRRPKRLASPFCKIRQDQSLFLAIKHRMVKLTFIARKERLSLFSGIIACSEYRLIRK